MTRDSNPRSSRSGARRAALALSLAAAPFAPAALAAPAMAPATFTKDVAPIFYSRCVECHRPGEVAPMSLLRYEEARPWAKAIRDKVSDRVMPPWLADPRYGHFENDRRLSDKEIATIVAWVNAGSPRGEDKDLPKPPDFADGWTMGKPDVVIAMPEEFAVPAEGVVPYQYVTVPSGFTEDRWVQAAEIRAGNRGVVHHIIVFTQAPPEKEARPATGGAPSEGRAGFDKLVGFAPGEQPRVYPKGTAKLVKAGSDFVFQIHYTTSGQAVKDRSYVGLYFAKEPVKSRALTATAMNRQFVIPAGDGNYEVKSSWAAREDVSILDLMPHMHFRGKDFTYTAVYPDGKSEVVLSVPSYDFNWQLVYRLEEPLFLPKGSRLDCVAHFDNSARNKYNPDPTKDVRWGDQTWEEMMIGWFDYVAGGAPARGGETTALK